MTGSYVSNVQSEKGVLIGSLPAEEGDSESLGELGFDDDMLFGGIVSGGNIRELPGRGMMNFLGDVSSTSTCWATSRLEAERTRIRTA
jgi:hypothetical protein